MHHGFAFRGGLPAVPPALLRWQAEVARARAQEEASQAVRRAYMQATLEAGVQGALAMLEAEAAEKAGDRYQRWEGRKGYRNGTAPGWIAIGGRKVQIRRPRLCDAEGREVHLDTYRALQDEQELNEVALLEVTLGTVMDKVHRAFARLQPLPDSLRAYGDSKSSICRRWIEASAAYLEPIHTRRLDDRRFLAILIDGKGFGKHVALAALGIDEQGQKVPLGAWPGTTENVEACSAFLDHLQARGLSVERGIVAITDGGKGIQAAIQAKWGDVVILGRCQEHKKRNVLRHLPKREHRWVERALWRAWHEPDADQAEQDLLALAEQLQERWPEAAASLREGLAETLTCQRLGLPPKLLTALRTTNLIENIFSTASQVTGRVRWWRNGEQVLRWVHLALKEAEPGLRPVASPKEMERLRQAIEEVLAERPRIHRLPLAG